MKHTTIYTATAFVLIVVTVVLGTLLIMGKGETNINALRSVFERGILDVSYTPDKDRESVVRESTSPGVVDERRSMLVPPRTSDLAKQREHFERLLANARTADMLTIKSECVIEPLVLHESLGGSFSIVNEGPTERTLSFPNGNNIIIPSNDIIEVSTDMFAENGEGAYGYGCNDLSGPAGVIIVAPGE